MGAWWLLGNWIVRRRGWLACYSVSVAVGLAERGANEG